MSALVIAAPSSGQGKTLFTFGLLRAFKQRSLNVQPFKVGPDYIDPKFHEHAAGHMCSNLDPWAMSGGRLQSALQGQNLNIIEGVMGLFDGAQSAEPTSTADLAMQLDAPVVLVVDCKGMAQSIAALVHGFKTYKPELNLAGVVLNRVASPKHEAMLRADLDVPVFGCLPRVEGLDLASRHLGLVQASEVDSLETKCEQASAWVTDNIDLDALIEAANKGSKPNAEFKAIAPLGGSIAVARDEAFAFAYPHLLADWKSQGAEISFFSPLANQAPLAAADAVYLPGGYPELHAEKLAGNSVFLDGMQAAKNRGAWIYGECGGFMVLGEGLIDAKGKAHAMCGLLPVTTSFANPKRHLGYRAFTSLWDTPLGPKGSRFRGHEFHFSAVDTSAEPDMFSTSDAAGNKLGTSGLIRDRVFGSYLHLIDRN